MLFYWDFKIGTNLFRSKCCTIAWYLYPRAVFCSPLRPFWSAEKRKSYEIFRVEIAPRTSPMCENAYPIDDISAIPLKENCNKSVNFWAIRSFFRNAEGLKKRLPIFSKNSHISGIDPRLCIGRKSANCKAGWRYGWNKRCWRWIEQNSHQTFYVI